MSDFEAVPAVRCQRGMGQGRKLFVISEVQETKGSMSKRVAAMRVPLSGASLWVGNVIRPLQTGKSDRLTKGSGRVSVVALETLVRHATRYQGPWGL
jgi:hypothetical protein